nr:uncharacterized protein LOC111855465 [Paramormyrops kingsleyae]XP_023690263.1 uncharacterized protein LOC111855465 [Paramormyrops kingsleyae]
MRPRSRLMAKKRLPTIREGYEELLQDMNQTNSCHTVHAEALSSEAYLQSICQLARPAFPLREPDREILALGSLDSFRSGLRLSNVSPPAPSRPPSPTARRHIHGNRGSALAFSNTPIGNHHGTPDPLEYLYGHQSNPILPTDLLQDAKGKSLPPQENRAPAVPCCRVRAHSFPRLCSSPPALRKNSCPEFSPRDTTSPACSWAEACPPTMSKTDDSGRPSCGVHAERGSDLGGQRENGGKSGEKHSVISHWIADCRSAWREARIRSCMLPAIAEM